MNDSEEQTHDAHQGVQSTPTAYYGSIDHIEFFCESDFESDSDSEDSNSSDQQGRKSPRMSRGPQSRYKAAPHPYMDSIQALFGKKPINMTQLLKSPEFLLRDNGLWARKTPYLSLPGEIRNRIMDYALAPGDVYLATKADPANWTGSKASTSGCDGPTSGCQMLATCKQVYMEGHEAFYAGNNFHLPPGPVEGFLKWYETLKPKHRELIRSVTIDISILDLTPSVLEQCESTYQRRFKLSIAQPSFARAIIDTVEIVLNTLREVWVQKIAEVYRLQAFHFVKLVDLYLCGGIFQRKTLLPITVMYLKGDDVARFLRPVYARTNLPLDFRHNLPSYYDGWDEKLMSLVTSNLEFVQREIIKHFDGLAASNQDFAWPRFKRWIRDFEMKARQEEHPAIIEHSYQDEEKPSDEEPR